MRKKTDAGAIANVDAVDAVDAAGGLSEPDRAALHAQLGALRLPFALVNDSSLAQTAADKQWSHVRFLQELIARIRSHAHWVC